MVKCAGFARRRRADSPLSLQLDKEAALASVEARGTFNHQRRSWSSSKSFPVAACRKSAHRAEQVGVGCSAASSVRLHFHRAQRAGSPFSATSIALFHSTHFELRTSTALPRASEAQSHDVFAE